MLTLSRKCGIFWLFLVFLLSSSPVLAQKDQRITDAVPGSEKYVQNTNELQTANFNISGNGTAGGTLSSNIVNAATQYNINGFRILGVAGNNLFTGLGAGGLNTDGFANSFFGQSAGFFNTVGNKNSFFGGFAGTHNITGSNNSFFGVNAGFRNTASRNSFFGSDAGQVNSIGFSNSFFGAFAGQGNSEGTANSFFGESAGQFNDGHLNAFFGSRAGISNTGDGNSFFGTDAGVSNTGGGPNTLIGFLANVGSGNLTNATAIGAHTIVSQSNSVVLGNGVFVGIGTSSPKAKLEVRGGDVFIAQPNGLIITSPNGACWRVSVDNSGIMSTNSVACPS